LEDIRNELLELYSEFKDNVNYDGLKDIGGKLNNIENSLLVVNTQLENKAKDISDRIDLEKEELYTSVNKLSSEFEYFKSNIDERFKTQVSDFISNNEHILSLFGEYSE
ncbi:hypothetical protein, partial [Brachyspira hampsonii]